MYECNENAPSPTHLTSKDSRYHDSDNSPSRPRAAASRNSSIAGPGTETLFSLGSHTNSHSISSNPGIILTPPSSTTLSTPSSTHLTDPAASTTAALAIFPNKNTSTNTRSTSTRTTNTQRQLEPTPELSDTGFYRQRAELAAHSGHELINVPHSQRLHPHHHRPSPRQSQVSSTLSPNLRPPPAIPIVTADGVVLTSNLDQLAKDSSPRSAAGSDEDHVMSFMRYDAAKDAMLPAYQASLGRSSTGSANVAGNENVSAWEEKERREVRH
ncbi:uncharacterized protein LDX57_004422 [Aspergillus melleus]|uniref:uncharacterized protein n=1 Tax=Aspergillus melleus TaxID=138277 RepID=UPI001E8E0EB2|nr:uncharacterized protein LDX57_004422 [Aspergillus melleus]KAH8426688.1 hypothetical protein LDX57_004422 [Aspergillus melleus]